MSEIRQLILDLGDPDTHVNNLAVDRLAEQGLLVVPALRAVLARGGGRARIFACHSLRKIGPAASEAIPEIVDAVLGGGEFLCYAGLAVLGDLGEEALPALAELIADPLVRGDAAESVLAIAKKFPGKVPVEMEDQARELVKSA